MFEERPYRQHRQASFSVWWCVGFMAVGLTAWHLELIPFIDSSRLHDTQQAHYLELDDFPADHNFTDTIERTETATPVREPFSEPRELSTIQNEFLGAQQPHFDEIGRSGANQSHSPAGIQQVGYRVDPGMQTWPPAQGEPSQISPEAPSRIDDVPPGQGLHNEPVPVRTLNYRPDLEPVPVRPLPPARGELPLRPAGYQTEPSEVTPPLNTSASNALYQTSEYDSDLPSLSPQPFLGDSSAESPRSLPQAGAPHFSQNSASTATTPAESRTVTQLDPAAEQDIIQLRELSTRYWKEFEERIVPDEDLLRLSHKIFFEPGKHYLPAYDVQPNDQLRLIARNYQVTWQYLARLNQVEPDKIRPGQQLKVLQGPFHAVVDLSQRQLTVHANGYYVHSFPVAVGKDHSTPTGEFPVLNKVENPTYYGPEGIIAADDPSNPLGEHWIDLGNSYGIHGTINPQSIGQAASKGCLRLHPNDVALLYDLLTTESIVIIRE